MEYIAEQYHGSAGGLVPRSEREKRREALFEEFVFSDEVSENF